MKTNQKLPETIVEEFVKAVDFLTRKIYKFEGWDFGVVRKINQKNCIRILQGNISNLLGQIKELYDRINELKNKNDELTKECDKLWWEKHDLCKENHKLDKYELNIRRVLFWAQRDDSRKIDLINKIYEVYDGIDEAAQAPKKELPVTYMTVLRNKNLHIKEVELNQITMVNILYREYIKSV